MGCPSSTKIDSIPDEPGIAQIREALREPLKEPLAFLDFT